jgi:PhzF family phenazine biosynthesis protein
MTTQTIYQVDAFTHQLFRGNPAAVCVLPQWLPTELMQTIAMENNLAETAFVVAEGDGFGIRWFTPTVEINLCGHATLASAFVLCTQLGYQGQDINFVSPRSGLLPVRRLGDDYELNFPANRPTSLSAEPAGLAEALGATGFTCLGSATDLLVVLPSEAEVAALKPDFKALGALPFRGVIATAAGSHGVDFVSRFFGPAVGVDEDPVTGSAHTVLVPYWADRLGKQRLQARQISARSGDLLCTLQGHRVLMQGSAVLYLKGEIFLPDQN